MITHPNVKINLGLHVLRKREDGYHELETLFVPYFGLSDTLEITVLADRNNECVSPDSDRGSCYFDRTPCHFNRARRASGEISIHIDYPAGMYWDPEKDLTYRAWQLLNADFGIPPVSIHLTKTSPVGAGLGGGSADAAFALRMLSELFGLGLSAASLACYAAQLGSDCPFFVYNTPMMGRGRGEVLTPFSLENILGPEYEIRVVVPDGIHVSTADAYRGIVPRNLRYSSSLGTPESSQTPTPSSPTPFGELLPLEEVLRTPIGGWKDLLVNDFEATVFAKYPALAELKASLYRQGAIYASMSGSGSALFGIFRK